MAISKRYDDNDGVLVFGWQMFLFKGCTVFSDMRIESTSRFYDQESAIKNAEYCAKELGICIDRRCVYAKSETKKKPKRKR